MTILHEDCPIRTESINGLQELLSISNADHLALGRGQGRSNASDRSEFRDQTKGKN